MRLLGRSRRLGRRKLVGLSATNLAVVVLLIVMELVIAERHWLSTFLTYMPQVPFAFVSGAILALTMLRREWRLSAVNCAAMLLVVVFLLGFRVPISHRARKSSHAVRVMTYNLHQGSLGIDKIVNVINRYHPDVLCVQEVNAWEKHSDPVWQIQQLQPKRWHVVRDGELAIFSRYEISSVHLRYLPMGTQRAILAAEVDVPGGRINVLNTHFNTATTGASVPDRKHAFRQHLRQAAEVRLAQTAALLAFAGEFDGPVIITGDLNTPPRGACHRRITRLYRDTFADAGWGFGYTYRSRVPLLRIDYVFADKSLGIAGCFVAGDVASDHRAVVADIIPSL